MQYVSYCVVLGYSACAVLGGWGYFRRYPVSRPPVGVFTLTDLVLMVLFILLMPFLYLILPLWLAAGLLGLSALSVLYFTWEPLLGRRWAIWLVTLGVLATDLGAAFLLGTSTNGFFAVNNAVLLIFIVGIANLWAQSGMKARDVALLSAFLTIYDFLATAHSPLMSDLFTHLAGLPLTPTVAWGSSSSVLGIGVGDLLLAAVFPLVLRKAFGRPAGITGLVLALGVISTLLALPLKGVFPVMVVLGPLIVLQYLYWSKRGGRERTMWQYLQAEPLRHRGQRLTSRGEPPCHPIPVAHS
jgi:hypothetical protein